MSEGARIQQLTEGLAQVLAGLSELPELASSVRRMARSVASAEGLPDDLRALAEAVDEADEAVLPRKAQELLEALKRPRDERAGDEVLRALLVEADVTSANVIREALEAAGFKVKWLTGAGGVWEILRKDPPQIMVVDIFLPDRDGRDLILDVSGDPETAKLPVIAVSPAGDRLTLTRSECLALGADAFMVRREAGALVGAEARRLVGIGDTGRDREASGVLRRARFQDRYQARAMDQEGGVVILLAFDGFRHLAEQRGPDVADAALAEVAARIGTRCVQVTDVGRWAPAQLVMMAPLVSETLAAEEVRAALGELKGMEWAVPGAGALAEKVSGAVVPTPPGTALADRLQVAGLVRLGLSSEGSRVLPAGCQDDGKRTLLVVEDDPTSRVLVTHKLRHAGFEIVEFEDGTSAAAAIPTLDFDLAILDVNLPGRDGFQLVGDIRGSEEGRRRPILILSGMGGDEDIVRGLELGADDYMLKPFSPVELTARVRRLLEGNRSAV